MGNTLANQPPCYTYFNVYRPNGSLYYNNTNWACEDRRGGSRTSSLAYGISPDVAGTWKVTGELWTSGNGGATYGQDSYSEITFTAVNPPPAPSVSLSGTASFCPPCGASGTYTYSATANSGSINSWVLRIDSGPILASGGGSVSSSYAWGGSSLAAGTYTMRLTATDTNGQSASATTTVTLIVPPPVTPTLTLGYTNLIWYGPLVSTPTQTLNWTISGGLGAPYSVSVVVTRPDAGTTTYTTTSGTTGSFGVAESGDQYFGTTRLGQWSARITATSGVSGTSGTVSWIVRFYDPNQKP